MADRDYDIGFAEEEDANNDSEEQFYSNYKA